MNSVRQFCVFRARESRIAEPQPFVRSLDLTRASLADEGGKVTSRPGSRVSNKPVNHLIDSPDLLRGS